MERNKTRDNLAKTYGMIIDNKDHFAERTFENRCPINTDWLLPHFPDGTAADAHLAIASAKRAATARSALHWQDGVALVRRAADLMKSESTNWQAVTTWLNVGKNRSESLGDAQEGAELLRGSCDSMEKHDGYVVQMGSNRFLAIEYAIKAY